MSSETDFAFSRTIVTLLKNAVFKETDHEIWDTVVSQKFKIDDYMNKIGLTLTIDEMDGYAYLRQRTYTEGEEEIPRLIPRHALSYPVSLLLVLLRKLLLEFDSSTGDQRLIVTKQQIAERMELFLHDTTNEAKVMADIDKYIDRVENMGFLRHLRGSEDRYEVQRILRSFVNAEWLNRFDERLEEYRRYAAGEETQEGESAT